MADSGTNKPGNKTKLIGLIGGQTIFGIVFMLLIIAAADKSEIRLDWSLSGTYTLHPATERISKKVQQNIKIIGIWTDQPEDQRQAYILSNRSLVHEKLQLIAKQSEKLSYKHIDYRFDKSDLKSFEDLQGNSARDLSIYIQSENGRQITVPYGHSLDQHLESSICSALLALEQTSDVSISLLTEVGELHPSLSKGDTSNTMSQFLHTLKLSGCDIQLLDSARLSKLGRIPQDSILCIPGATSSLGPNTIKHVNTFLQSGGNALIFADYRCPQDLADLLKQRGVMLGVGNQRPKDIFNDDAAHSPPLIICSADQSIIQQDGRYDRLNLANTHYESMNPQHPISARTASSNRSLLLPYTTMLNPMFPQMYLQVHNDFPERMQAWGTPPYKIDVLLQISGKIWPSLLEHAQTFRSAKDSSLPLACAISYQLADDSVIKDKESRMVVVASRQFIADETFALTKHANDLFTIDAISWLAFREQASDVPPNSYQSLQVDCSEDSLNIIGYFMILFIPLICLGLAMLTWWDRR